MKSRTKTNKASGMPETPKQISKIPKVENDQPSGEKKGQKKVVREWECLDS